MSTKPHQPDYSLITIVSILVIFGLVILASASVVISQDLFNENYHFLKHQLIFSLPLGLLGFFILQKIHYKRLQKISFFALVLSVILLGLVLAPGMGYSTEGVKRWLNIGSFSFQPFELTKLTFILYLSSLLGKSKEESNEAIRKSIIPLLAVIGVISFLVICQPNMSALIIIFLLTLVIYFLAGTKWSYLLSATVVIIIAVAVLAQMAPYRMARLTIFLHPELDPQGTGYQINQALLAIGSGGMFGLGLGHSVQKWKYLPEVVGDSIFAIVAEELGLIGAGFLVLLFIVLAWRGFKIAKNAPDRFGYLLAGGITAWLFFQAFINMGAISGILPLTGMPLPFISYGGSSLIVSLSGVGILVNISKYSK